jgi:hypothetical protein
VGLVRGWAALALLVVALAGCRHDSPSTSLTLVATNPYVGRATFALECDPPGGDVPRPADACRGLARDPEVLLRPERFVCFGGLFSWWTLRITGRHDGAPVDIRIHTCWTSQMELIRVLGIGRVVDRHIDPLSRPVFFGRLPRSELADRVEIPEETPDWVLRLAHRTTRKLGDPRPDRLSVEPSAGAFRITLEGDFACERCEGGRASRAQISVGRASRQMDSIVMDGS